MIKKIRTALAVVRSQEFPDFFAYALRKAHHHLSYLGISALAKKSGAPDPGLAWEVATEDVAAGIYPRIFRTPDQGPYSALLQDRPTPFPGEESR